jgi:uncharacterized membrane protein YedE/YeeE
MQASCGYALAGGALIGAAASLLLLTHGRVAGISGILGVLVSRDAGDRDWRLAFLAGLLSAGVVAMLAMPSRLGAGVVALPMVAAAGFLVGIGTRVGGGCTSGHGVCGLSRGSVRSLIATMVFMAVAAVTVAIAGRLS